MLNTIRYFHDGIKATLVNLNLFFFLLAQSLFSFKFSKMLLSIKKKVLHWKSDNLQSLVRDILHTDDFVIVANSEDDLQQLTKFLSVATRKFGLPLAKSLETPF